MKTNVIVMCVVVLLAIVMPGPAHGLERVSITETWQTANPEGEIIFEKSDGEVTAVSDLGTGFRWGGWMEPNTKGKYPETRIDWDAKDRDGILSDFTDAKFEADGFEGGTHIYTIFSSKGTNVPDMNVPNLETVSLENTKRNDWTGRLTIRDAQGNWYLSSPVELPGVGVQTIQVAGLTWQEIIGETAKDMNELDAGGPHEEQLGGAGDGDGPGPITASVTDANSTSPDMSFITGAGFVYAGPAPGPKVWFGPVTWQGFETPPTAFGAFPAWVVLDSPWGITSRWKTGLDVVGEAVYFGENPNNLTDVTAQVVDNTYTPGNLELGKTYYWRVDSEKADGTVLPPEGGTWSFSVAEYAVVEDFESFSDKTDNRIFQTWTDGWGYTEPEPGSPGNGTGSTVGYLDSPFAEQSIVHGGGVSMPFAYNNTGADGKKRYSETERTLDAHQDWTGVGGRALTLYAYGDANATPAATDKIYVALEDSAGNVGVARPIDDVNMTLEDWQEINIDLQDFNSAGVDLTSIKKIYLGVGNMTAPQVGGTGKLFFDDIRVYLPRCLPEKSGLKGDLNGDCAVDQTDMDLLMTEYGLKEGDVLPLTSGALITGARNELGRVAFTEDWIGHQTFDDSYDPFYVIAEEGGAPVLDINLPEDGYYKFPRVNTANKVDFTGTTTASIVWKAKEGNALALFCAANNGGDLFYQFQFVLYDNGLNQILGWAPNDDVDEDPNPEYPWYEDGPTYILNSFEYADLVTGMDFDVYVTLDLTVVVDDADVCTVDYTVTQDGVKVQSGNLSPTPVRGNDRNWHIGSAFGNIENEGEYPVGGFVKSCDITYTKVLTVDLNGDGVVDDLDFAIVEAEMGQRCLWP